MPRYLVRVREVVLVEYEVEADSEEGAAATFLGAGTRIEVETIRRTVEDVERVESTSN